MTRREQVGGGGRREGVLVGCDRRHDPPGRRDRVDEDDREVTDSVGAFDFLVGAAREQDPVDPAVGERAQVTFLEFRISTGVDDQQQGAVLARRLLRPRMMRPANGVAAMPSKTRPTTAVRRFARATRCCTYPSCSAARMTRSRVSARTARVPFRACETVDGDTPAAAATCATLARPGGTEAGGRSACSSPGCMVSMLQAAGGKRQDGT